MYRGSARDKGGDMTKISPATRVENMIKGLEELQNELYDLGPHYDGVIRDITQALSTLDKVRKSLRG